MHNFEPSSYKTYDKGHYNRKKIFCDSFEELDLSMPIHHIKTQPVNYGITIYLKFTISDNS